MQKVFYLSLIGDVDYVSAMDEVHLISGQLRVCTSIKIIDDEILERTEDFLVIVENFALNDLFVEGLTLAPAITYVCITNDDSKSTCRQNLHNSNQHCCVVFMHQTLRTHFTCLCRSCGCYAQS